MNKADKKSLEPEQREANAISKSINRHIDKRREEILFILTKYHKFFKTGLDALESYNRQFHDPELIKSKIDEIRNLMVSLSRFEEGFITAINYNIHDDHNLAQNLKNINDLVAGLITTKFDFEKFKAGEISAQQFVLFFSNKLNQYERLVKVLEIEIHNVDAFANQKKFRLF
jgi:hypothetical protein